MRDPLPKRKPTRWSEIDYSTEGLYFITICTHQRKQTLATIVGEGSPLPRLTLQGHITQKYINKINEKYPHITVDSYVIMPNHIHLILIVGKHDGRENPSPTVSSVIAWLKYQITKEINTGKQTVQKIFQRSFHDRVIRNMREYEEIAQYIAKNPQMWCEDCFYQ